MAIRFRWDKVVQWLGWAVALATAIGAYVTSNPPPR